MKWSLSAHKTFRRCQRQYFFSHIAANHKAIKDPLRREAYLLKQIKNLATWKGSVIHQGIQKYLVPNLIDGKSVDCAALSDRTLDLARRQFAFSKALKYREPNIVKSRHEDYCILAEHDRREDISDQLLDTAYSEIADCFKNQAFEKRVIGFITGHKRYYAEHNLVYEYEGAQIKAVADLIFTRPSGNIVILDWKYEQDRSFADHKHQVALYGWILKHAWKVQRLEQIELYEVQLRDCSIVKHELNEPVFDELEDLMFQSIHEIRSLCNDHKYDTQNIEDFEFAKSSNSCSYCSFLKLCREAR